MRTTTVGQNNVPLTARTLKRIGVGALVVVAVGAIAIVLLRRYAETYSFAPESPEQPLFAQQHAQCAGVYMVLRAWARRNEGAEYRELETQYASEFEHHVKLGFNFSPDKKKYQAQIEAGAAEFNKDIIQSGVKGQAAKVVNDRITACFEATVRSANFIERTLIERARR